MTDDLIAAHAENPKLMPYLHLPVQSGSDARAQGHEPRPHGGRLSPAHRAASAQARPDMALSGDFIVGFPGETDADFRATLDLVREVRYAARLFLQIFAAPRNARRRARDQIPRGREIRPAAASCRR